MKKRLTLMCTVLALGSVVAGCGGGGGDNGDTKAKNPPSGGAPAPSGGGAAKASAKVGLKNIAFNPSSITVRKGTTVTWTNQESVPHDVTKTGGPGPDFSSGKGNLKLDDTYKQTFNTVGKIDYVCTIHPNMTGSVTVK